MSGMGAGEADASTGALVSLRLWEADVNEAEGHPSVSGLGAGEADAGCGAGITKAAEIGFKQDSGDPTRALDTARNPGTELRQGYA